MRAITLLSILLFSSILAWTQRSDIIPLENQLKVTPTLPLARALSKAYQDQALWYRETPQFNRDSTVFYFDKAVALLEATLPLQHKQLAMLFLDITDRSNRSHPFIIIDSLAAKGWSYYEKVSPNEKDKLLEYGLLNNWASIKVEKGEPKKANELFAQAFSLIQNDTNPAVQAKYLKDKGRFLQRYGLPEDQQIALQYINQSLKLYESLDAPDKNVSLSSLYKINLLSYQQLSSNDSVDFYFQKLKSLIPILKNPFHSAWYYAVKGEHLKELKQNAAAIASIMEAKKILETYKMQNVDTYEYVHGLLGEIAFDEKRYDDAITFFTKEREICLLNNFRNGGIISLSSLADAYAAKGDYAEALTHEKKFTEETLDFNKERNERSLRENELQLNVLKQDKELTQKRNEQIIFIVAFAIAAVLMSLLYYNYRLKQRTNNQLAKLNTELETKNTLLDKRNAENELLLKEIHHRVKNNLEVVSSLLELQSAQIEDPSVQSAMLASQNRVHSMGIIHQKLYQGEHLTAIEMRDYFVILGESIVSSFNAEGRVKIECDMPKLILDVDTAISVGLITNELLTNSLKYAFVEKEKGEIKISLHEQDTHGGLLLKIADDGIGKRMNEKAKGTGFGTQLINLLTQQLNGTLTYETGNGTSVSLNFKRTKSIV